MQMIKRGTGEFKKIRGLISGGSMTGKTKSFATFDEPGKSMVILVCPGETGLESLPVDSERITSYYIEAEKGENINDAQWSRDALKIFNDYYSEIERNEPDKLFIDGLHCLYDHIFNVITDGEWLGAKDLNAGGNPYRSANFYNHAHRAFANRLAGFYTSPIPFVCCTVWEEWQSGKTETDKPGGIQAERFLHPALPGASALRVTGKFTFRISARTEEVCIHKNCAESKVRQKHYVWQFYPRGTVEGVGIKGLSVTNLMAKTPYIHQTWSALQNLMKRV